jgi:hypothetical protein
LYSLAVYNGTPPALYCLSHLSPISTRLLPLLPLYPSKETTNRRREKKRTKLNPPTSESYQSRNLSFLSFFLSLHHVTQSSKILNIEFSIQYSLRKDRERGRGREGGREE